LKGWRVLTGWGGCCSEYMREKMWARIHLTPVLLAEDDRDAVRKFWADQDREQELLGQKTSPYFGKR
jgi:NADH dehydrogenase (ubiquinone) 1 alpha subcomplex subunit 13